MIYFLKGSIKFPRHSSENSNILTIINELTGDKTAVEFTDLSLDDRYYMIDCSSIELKDGTYRYMIGQETGLMQVGDYNNPNPEYENKKENKVYGRSKEKTVDER